MKSNPDITYPITEQDFKYGLRLIEQNLFKWDLTADQLKNASYGEVLIAKKDNKVVGMLNMWRQGKIFGEISDKHFVLDKIKYPKKDLGYIALVSVSKDYQKQGVGKLLVEKAIDTQKEWGAKAIIVHASKSSPGNASEKLFSSFGFLPIHLHKKPWHEYSKEKGSKGFYCNFCGNPCICDELEMVKYL